LKKSFPLIIILMILFHCASNLPCAAYEPFCDVTILAVKPNLNEDDLKYILLNLLETGPDNGGAEKSFDLALELYRPKLENSRQIYDVAWHALSKKRFRFFEKTLPLIKDINLFFDSGKNFLCKAIEEGNTTAVELLLERSADPNAAKDENNSPPLFLCVEKKNTAFAKLLIGRGAKINVIRNGATALYRAVEKKDIETARLLIENGADINLCKNEYNRPLKKAIRNNDVEMISLLLDNKASLNILNDFDEKPFVNFLIKNCDESVVLNFIEKGLVENLNACNRNGQTPLHFAIRNHKKKIAMALASRGANLEVTNPPGSPRAWPNSEAWTDGETLAYMTATENTDLLELAVRGLDPSKVKNNSKNLATAAIDNDNTKAVELLITIFKDYNWEYSGGYPAAYAMKKGKTAMLDFILGICQKKNIPSGLSGDRLENKSEKNKYVEAKPDTTEILIRTVDDGTIEAILSLIKNGADVNALDRYKSSTLHRAVMRGKAEKVKLLLENGANINLKDGSGMTALLYSIHEKKPEIAKILIENGADIENSDSEDDKILHLAIERGYFDIAKLIIERGYNVNRLDGYNESALYEAIAKDDTGCVKLLLDHSAEVVLCNTAGKTPLHLAAERGNIAIAGMLIERGAKIDIRGLEQAEMPKEEPMKGSPGIVMRSIRFPKRDDMYNVDDNLISPLIAAILSKKMAMVDFLIRNNANVNLCSRKKLAPIHYAISTFQNEVFDALIKNGADTKVKTTEGLTLLGFAISNDNLYATKRLIELEFKNDPNPTSAGTEGPLHIAERNGVPAVTEYLRKIGADPNLKDSSGMTAEEIRKERLQKAAIYLESALETTDPDEMSKLARNAGEDFHKICHIACECDRDPGPSQFKPEFMNLPNIHKAIWLNMPDAAMAYIESRSDENERKWLVQSVFDLAVKLKRKKVVQYLMSKDYKIAFPKDILFTLKSYGWTDQFFMAVEKGADINVKNAYGKSILSECDFATFKYLTEKAGNLDFNNPEMLERLDYYLCSGNSSVTQCVEIIDYFARNKFDFNSKTRYGVLLISSVFTSRCGGGRAEDGLNVIRALLRAGADLKKEATAEKLLVMAVEAENVRTIEFLLEHGAQISKTCFYHAASRNNIKIIEILLAHGGDIKNSGTMRAALDPFVLNANYNNFKSEKEEKDKFDAACNTIKFLISRGVKPNENPEKLKIYEFPLAVAFSWDTSKGPLSHEKADGLKKSLIELLMEAEQ